jgi:prophage antirepressor-like protein
MNTLTFFFEQQGIEIIIIDDVPYFVANDICEILGIKNSRDALSALDKDEVISVESQRSGQKRSMNAVNESGLYALIFKSQKPQAKAFRKWVTGEVLPQIRKTGSYSLHTLPENVSVEVMNLVKQLFAELSAQLLDKQAKNLENLAHRLTQIEKKTATLPADLDAFVYIFHNPDNDAYKIGHTKDLNLRASNGRTFLPNLKTVLAIPCPDIRYATAFENMLHAHFYYKRLNMEWYRLEADDLIQIYELVRALGLA